MQPIRQLFELPLTVERWFLEDLVAQVSSRFERHTTVVRLEGDGEQGVGEDVTYEADEQARFQRDGLPEALNGRFTLGRFCERLDGLDLFSRSPRHASSALYRRWALESAALDLALRQSGVSLSGVLGRVTEPIRFVVSMRLGDPPEFSAVEEWLEQDPSLRFKLDAVSNWTDELCTRLATTGAVESIDFKGAYRGTIVDQPPDEALYRRVVRLLPDVLLEDPAWTKGTRAALAGAEDRITWDAPIHTIADIEELPIRPRSLNVKPSRTGRLRDLFELYAYCEREGIACYGGGQFELGPGRGQAQLLASLFHPGAPNDLAPHGFNVGRPRPGLPRSPLTLVPAATGFRLEDRRTS